jgi:hypothetical protein
MRLKLRSEFCASFVEFALNSRKTLQDVVHTFRAEHDISQADKEQQFAAKTSHGIQPLCLPS